MGIEFRSSQELYMRVHPALTSKVKEFKRNKILFVKEEDIWNYLIETKWKYGKNLELFHIVDDILNTSNHEIEQYVLEKMQNFERKINLDNIDLTS